MTAGADPLHLASSRTVRELGGAGRKFDLFNVHVDGVSIIQESLHAAGTSASFAPETGVVIIENTSLFTTPEAGDNPNFLDAAYDMGLQSVFDTISHTGSTLTVDFFASGAGWSGGGDETFAIDNVEVILNGVPVPEPSTLGMLAAPAKQPRHVVIDTTGLKVFGAGKLRPR